MAVTVKVKGFELKEPRIDHVSLTFSFYLTVFSVIISHKKMNKNTLYFLSIFSCEIFA